MSVRACVCACARVCAYVRTCVCACVRVCVPACASMFLIAHLLHDAVNLTVLLVLIEIA